MNFREKELNQAFLLSDQRKMNVRTGMSRLEHVQSAPKNRRDLAHFKMFQYLFLSN